MNSLIRQTNRLLCESDEEYASEETYYVDTAKVGAYIKEMWKKHGKEYIADEIGDEDPEIQVDDSEFTDKFLEDGVNRPDMIEYIQKNFGDEYGMGHVKFKGEEFNIEETGEMGDYVRKLLGDAIDEDIESGREELRTTIRDYEAPINSWNL
jgi:hypothetical protein